MGSTPGRVGCVAKTFVRLEPPNVHPRRACRPDRKTGDQKPVHIPILSLKRRTIFFPPYILLYQTDREKSSTHTYVDSITNEVRIYSTRYYYICSSCVTASLTAAPILALGARPPARPHARDIVQRGGGGISLRTCTPGVKVVERIKRWSS